MLVLLASAFAAAPADLCSALRADVAHAATPLPGAGRCESRDGGSTYACSWAVHYDDTDRFASTWGQVAARVASCKVGAVEIDTSDPEIAYPVQTWHAGVSSVEVRVADRGDAVEVVIRGQPQS